MTTEPENNETGGSDSGPGPHTTIGRGVSADARTVANLDAIAREITETLGIPMSRSATMRYIVDRNMASKQKPTGE
jgi:hypothetical protein